MFRLAALRPYLLVFGLLLIPVVPDGDPTETPPLQEQMSSITEREDAFGISQVWVPAGVFIAGSTQEEADYAYETCVANWPEMCLAHEYAAELFQHEVEISYGFWIDQYEVTNAAYQMFVDSGGYLRREYWTSDGWRWKGDRSGPNDRDCPQDLLEPQMPRTCITWYEADAYARWRGGRLPTEAEWEYAARGPDGLTYPWGNMFDGTKLNYCDETCANRWRDLSFNDDASRLAVVGSYPAGVSWVGAHDMAGNVWEWTDNWFDALYHQSGISVDPVGLRSGVEKVLRGGSWNMPYIFSRTAYRDGVLPDSWSGIIGFRIVTLTR